MIYLTTIIAYSEENKFELRSIYVGSQESTFILRRDNGYIPEQHPINFFDLVYPSGKLMAAYYGIGQIRKINDRDEKSLAAYIKSKIDRVDISNPLAEKTLFDVLNNFGGEYDGQ